MSRQKYIESQNASCQNWRWSWSFINEAEKTIIFGEFDNNIDGDKALILSESWQRNAQGRKPPGYLESREHVRLVEEMGFTLKTFTLIYSDENRGADGLGRATIKSFKENISVKYLIKEDKNWYAVPYDNTCLPEQIHEPKKFLEGASTKVSINAFERDPKARKVCLNYYGFQCRVCHFNFENVYGALGKDYIHVHHKIPLSQIKREYEVDPIKDLIPVCPNCHAMLHRTQEVLSIEELQKLLDM